MRVGRNTDVRPVGGGVGCVAMLVGSILLSVVATVLLNLLLR